MNEGTGRALDRGRGGRVTRQPARTCYLGAAMALIELGFPTHHSCLPITRACPLLVLAREHHLLESRLGSAELGLHVLVLLVEHADLATCPDHLTTRLPSLAQYSESFRAPTRPRLASIQPDQAVSLTGFKAGQ